MSGGASRSGRRPGGTAARGHVEEALDARVVRALGHPIRVRILELLQARELASPAELARTLGRPLGTVSYHVKQLERLGFLELARRTRHRGAVEHHYRLRELLADGRAGRRVRGDDGGAAAPAAPVPLARALADASAAVAVGGFDAVEACAVARVVHLDARGAAQARAALERLARGAERIERTCARRLAQADGSAAPRAAIVATALFAAEE